MTKRIGVMLLITCLLFMLIDPAKAKASTTTKEIQNGKEYTVDLDGDGKNEHLKMVIKETDTKYSVRIFINGKKMRTYTYPSDNHWVWQMGYTDLNKKDKYKEIFFIIVGEDAYFDQLRMLRYQKGNLKPICTEKWQYNKINNRIRVAPKQRGDGTITISSDTPFMQGKLGFYYIDMMFNIKKGTLAKSNQSTFKVSKNWKNQKYTLTKTITFMTTRDGKRKAYTAKKGTIVYLNRLYCKSLGGKVYVEMRNKAGKTGWMKVTNSKFYKEEYAWA